MTGASLCSTQGYQAAQKVAQSTFPVRSCQQQHWTAWEEESWKSSIEGSWLIYKVRVILKSCPLPLCISVRKPCSYQSLRRRGRTGSHQRPPEWKARLKWWQRQHERKDWPAVTSRTGDHSEHHQNLESDIWGTWGSEVSVWPYSATIPEHQDAVSEGAGSSLLWVSQSKRTRHSSYKQNHLRRKILSHIFACLLYMHKSKQFILYSYIWGIMTQN